MTPVPIASLAPGRRFLVAGLGKAGELLRVGAGSAHVAYEVRVERSFTTSDGQQHSFTRRRELADISLATLVVPIADGAE